MAQQRSAILLPSLSSTRRGKLSDSRNRIISLRRALWGMVRCVDGDDGGASRITSSTREPEGSQAMSRRSPIGSSRMLGIANFQIPHEACDIRRAFPELLDYAVRARVAYIAAIVHPVC
jgi:hypothetical protein